MKTCPFGPIFWGRRFWQFSGSVGRINAFSAVFRNLEYFSAVSVRIVSQILTDLERINEFSAVFMISRNFSAVLIQSCQNRLPQKTCPNGHVFTEDIVRSISCINCINNRSFSTIMSNSLFGFYGCVGPGWRWVFWYYYLGTKGGDGEWVLDR